MFRKIFIILGNLFRAPKVQTPEEYWKNKSIKVIKR